MKTRLTWITLMVLLVGGSLFTMMTSCDKLQNAADFKVKYKLPNRTFTIDSLNHLKTEQLLYSQSFTANIDSLLGANDGLLGDASFYLLQMSVVSPDWVTLDWLTSARITITPTGGATTVVATATSVDPIARTVNFEVENINIAAAITGPYVVNLYGNLSGPIPAGSIQMLLESGIEVTVNPL
jgi:hypothetical protein